MRGLLNRRLTAAVFISMMSITTPAIAQLSPAQVKAQRDKLAREAAARAQAGRERAAAEANARERAAAAAKQQSARAEIEKQAAARKRVGLLAARQQAIRERQLNIGFMVGRWADNDPSYCREKDGYSGIYFAENGEWGAYESGGKWSVRDGNLIFHYEKYDGDGDPYGGNKLIGYTDRINKVVSLSENLLVVEVEGGTDAWFRCEAVPTNLSKPKTRFAEPNYVYYEDAWRSADEIETAWTQGKLPEAFQLITAYFQAFPQLTYKTSNLMNYAGLYQWKSVGDRNQAAAWFLRNYQSDPSGTRAPDSLLSLAHVMHEMGSDDIFCKAIKQFKIDYPFEAQYRLKIRFSSISELATCL